MAISSQRKQELIRQFAAHQTDTGRCEVQIALLTERISMLSQHLQEHRKDLHSRRGLLAMVAARRCFLDYLKRHDVSRYQQVLQQLQLRR